MVRSFMMSGGRGGGKIGVIGKMEKSDKTKARITDVTAKFKASVAEVGTASTLPIVIAVGESMTGFFQKLEMHGGEAALEMQALSLLKTSPTHFNEILAYLRTSGAGSAEVKLGTISTRFFVGMQIDLLIEGLRNVQNSCKHALSLGYDKAVLENASKEAPFKFAINDFLRLLETVQRNAHSASSTDLAIVDR
jgi:hypothetical protein